MKFGSRAAKARVEQGYDIVGGQGAERSHQCALVLHSRPCDRDTGLADTRLAHAQIGRRSLGFAVERARTGGSEMLKIDIAQVETAAKELYVRALKQLPPDIKAGFARLVGN